MPPTLPQVLAACGATRDDANNWDRRDLLAEKLPETTPGVARVMTRPAALNLAFLAALKAVGFDLVDAAARARDLVGAERKGKLPGWLVYSADTKHGFAFGDKGAKTPISSMAMTLAGGEGSLVGADDMVALKEPEPALHFAVVNLAAIVKRIDSLFKD